MICAHCSKPFAIDRIVNQRGKGLNAEIQCPLCQAWLGRSAAMARVKMASFYIGFIAMVWGYFDDSMRNFCIPVSIFAVMLLLVCHMMDHIKVTETPEIEDTSEQRQKYR
ncbi:hypothetical protein [Shewanella youngdeokensis]|uniref:Uncharacterized protein n=1 Tax=Shewanella youngdeokensis TaxID=2999068 RepID=A0ABZ0JX54_9GAMM|nr:hypothetical protein RGE70_15775 [Shewanella sp. DAU334]